MRSLTPEEVSQIQGRGGGAVLRKLQAVEKKVKKSGTVEDTQEYDDLLCKCLQLIAVAPTATTADPVSSAPPEVKYPEALVDEINAMVAEATGPIFDAWSHGVLDNETAKSDIDRVTNRIVNSRLKRYKQLFYLRRLSQNKRTLTIKSRILGENIILGPPPAETHGWAVYSYDELIALVETGVTDDADKFKAVHTLKVGIDGEVLSAKAANSYQRAAWDKDDGKESKAGSGVGEKAVSGVTSRGNSVNPDEGVLETTLLDEEEEGRSIGNEKPTISGTKNMEGVLV